MPAARVTGGEHLFAVCTIRAGGYPLNTAATVWREFVFTSSSCGREYLQYDLGFGVGISEAIVSPSRCCDALGAAVSVACVAVHPKVITKDEMFALPGRPGAADVDVKVTWFAGKGRK